MRNYCLIDTLPLMPYSPVVLGLFASYFMVVLLGLLVIKTQTRLTRVAIWLFDQTELFRNFKYTKGLDTLMVKAIRSSRRHAICVWVKGDDVSPASQIYGFRSLRKLNRYTT